MRRDNSIQIGFSEKIVILALFEVVLSFVTIFNLGFWDLLINSSYFIFALSLIVSFILWLYFGSDEPSDRTVVPEVEPPCDIDFHELALLYSNGSTKKNFLMAMFLNLVVKKYIMIIPPDEGKNNYLLRIVGDTSSLSEIEKSLIDLSFLTGKIGDTAALSGLKAVLFKRSKFFEYNTLESLIEKGYARKDSYVAKRILNVIKLLILYFILIFLTILLMGICFNGTFVFVSSMYFMIGESLFQLVSCCLMFSLSVLILHFFAKKMIRLTPEGQNKLKDIEGFKLYLEMAEQKREEFNDQNGILTRFLPYIIIFGADSRWLSILKKTNIDDSLLKFYMSNAILDENVLDKIKSDLKFELSKLISEFQYDLR